MSGFFRDERGVTTVGMAISLFISVALIFSGAQLYRVHSASAEVQEVADVCALAAENEVAGIEVAANTCDGVCLSLTLLSVSLYGLGLVAACVPPAEGVSVKLMEWGRKAADARDGFYEKACLGLNAAQRVLPFLATCNAMAVAQANDAGAMQASYMAAAILVPQQFEELGSAGDDGLGSASEQIDGQAQDIRDAAQRAEEAAERANAAKERGFLEDCGLDPAYCMRERASSLAGLSGADNPAYASVDAWSFSVALERAKAYYQARLASWQLEGRSTEEQADSVIRKRFYQYAIDELAGAYVHDEDGTFSAFLPHLFRNTDEMRATPLYTEVIYPITVGSDQVMHAWSGCPRAAGAVRMGSVSELEVARGSFAKCPACEFVPSSVGSVAAASTSIKNGFENHYEQMRQACEEYVAARAELDPLAQQVRDQVSPLLDALMDVLGKADACRIHIQPPGREGALALVVNTAESRADAGFESTFVAGGATLGTCVAVSAATLVEDERESAGSFVTESLASLLPGGGGGVGAAAIAAAGAWMSVLRAYEDGQAALEDAVTKGLGSFSQNSASGIGAWAAKALTSIVSAVGLEPADTACRKPQVLNTRHVAEVSDDAVCVSFVQAKDAALAASSPSTSFADAALDAAAGAFGGTGAEGGTFSIAQVQLPFGAERVINWAIPNAQQDAEGLLSSGWDALKSTVSGALGVRSWQ